MANTGFAAHVKMAFTHTPANLIPGEDKTYMQNRTEKFGDFCAYHVVHGPTKIKELMTDPRVVTIALTALTMSGVQFGFYPIRTFRFTRNVINLIAKFVPAWTVKFALYLTTQSAVLGLGSRALGRFLNQELMTKWYNEDE